jgi:hypothetical protein
LGKRGNGKRFLGHKADGEVLVETETIRHVAIYGSHDRKGKRWELGGTEEQLRPALKLAIEHPPKQRFVHNPYPNVVLGDWDSDMVKVDWDERFLCEVKRFSKILCERYKLGGFIILESSTKLHKVRDETLTDYAITYRSKSYHTVFDEPKTHDEVNAILAWLCLFTKDTRLITWYLLQMIKGTYTLRQGFKGRKKPPRIVYGYGKGDKQITKFLRNRLFIHSLLVQNMKEVK